MWKVSLSQLKKLRLEISFRLPLEMKKISLFLKLEEIVL